jgi:hypothetical protein
MAILDPRRRRTRRLWASITSATALTAVLLLVIGTATANLTGSTFEGNDGNLVVNTPGNTDWANVNPVVGIDQPSGGSDNSFGQGTKEDSPLAKVVTGSIPPNKNDLTRFYVSSESAGGNNFLYLAWERLVNIGNANMDLEINQNATAGFTGTTTGPVMLNRTVGDLLVTYDFGGSGTPTLGLLTWVTTGATSQCFASNSLPCWGNRVNLTAAGAAEGAVNTVTVTDPINPGAPRTLTAGLFGEAAINLTAAGVFPPGVCKAFGSTFLKSRASSSFTAEVKDFIAPQPVNISNCGKITIIKHTSPRGIDQDFSYTSNLNEDANAGGVAGVDAQGNFSLNDAGNTTGDSTANTVSEELFAGTYTVTEGADPTGFAYDSVSCTGGTTATSGKTVTITLAPDDDVTCTYVNNQQLGAIKITKTSIKAATPLAGATFSITSGGNPIAGSPFTTGSDGTVCVDHLAFGTYSVQETAAPGGYAIDDTTAHDVVVGANSTCGDGNEATFAATDTPLSEIGVTFTSLAGAGVTNASIVCADGGGSIDAVSENGSADPAFDDTDETFTDLAPGTYTCTVVVDP